MIFNRMKQGSEQPQIIDYLPTNKRRQCVNIGKDKQRSRIDFQNELGLRMDLQKKFIYAKMKYITKTIPNRQDLMREEYLFLIDKVTQMGQKLNFQGAMNAYSAVSTSKIKIFGKNSVQYVQTLVHIATLLKENGQNQKALHQLQVSSQIIRQLKLTSIRSKQEKQRISQIEGNIFEKMAQIWRNINQYAKAVHYLQKSHEIRSQIFGKHDCLTICLDYKLKVYKKLHWTSSMSERLETLQARFQERSLMADEGIQSTDFGSNQSENQDI